jgi:hypothetical protein
VRTPKAKRSSLVPVARSAPSFEIATEFTCSKEPGACHSSWPVAKRVRLIVWSWLLLITAAPSRVKATDVTPM